MSPYFEFYVPEITFIELDKHFGLLKMKTDLKERNLELIIKMLTEKVDVVPESKF
jgi:hypothetical protein